MPDSTPIGVIEHAMVCPGDLSWQQLLAGTSAVHPLNGEIPVPIGASVPFQTQAPEHWPHELVPRAVFLADEALKRLQYDPERSYGLVLGMPNLTSDTEYLEHIMPHRHEIPKRVSSSVDRGDGA